MRYEAVREMKKERFKLDARGALLFLTRHFSSGRCFPERLFSLYLWGFSRLNWNQV